MFAKHTGRHAARTSLLAQIAPRTLIRLVAPLVRATVLPG